MNRSMRRNAASDARNLRSDVRARAIEGIDQVGWFYTAQGFESDYVGVIFGPDLVYRPMDGGWVGQRHESRDRIVSRGVTDAELHRLRQEHLPRPPYPRPPRLLRLLHRQSDARLLHEPNRKGRVPCATRKLTGDAAG